MDILKEPVVPKDKTFFTHVFSSTEEDKAEILNVIQYALLGIIPVVILNKLVQRFIPDADTDKSNLEILAEIFIQMIVIFCGIIIIHRIITYVPTYSGFKYENLTITNAVLAFLVIALSIQTKLGIKVNIIYDRLVEMWNGTSDDKKTQIKQNLRISTPKHAPSQADYLDSPVVQNDVFPPAPIATSSPNMSHGVDNYDYMMRNGGNSNNAVQNMYQGPIAANTLIGGSFGSSF